MLNQLSFYCPQLLFRDKHIPIFLQNSARSLKAKSVGTFLSCLLNLFEFGDDLLQEFAGQPALARTLFLDLVYLLEKTFTSNSEIYLVKMAVILLKKFLQVPFADKAQSVKHLIERLASMDLFSFSPALRGFFHMLVVDVGHFVWEQKPKELSKEKPGPSLASLGSHVLISLNESFQRIHKMHFAQQVSAEEAKK